MDAVVKPTWTYYRRPLAGTAQAYPGTAQAYRSDEQARGYTRLRFQKYHRKSEHSHESASSSNVSGAISDDAGDGDSQQAIRLGRSWIVPSKA